MADSVLILGGYGVFGGRLARRLAAAGLSVIVAGRSLDRAKAHCRRFGGRPYRLDCDGELDAAFSTLAPAIVIDAAGPFQAYGGDPHRVARAAIRHGAHYLDLADDSGFVAGIGALDAEAKQAGVVALSGASSVPAISAAALDELTRGLAEVALVEATILPGNRAPRGQSVVSAIVAQVGRPLAVWRGGRWRNEPAWSDLVRVRLGDGGASLGMRLASRIDAPDRLLFPARYGARSALFRAGLELKMMHVGLWLLGWGPRLGLMQSLAPLARLLKWMADRLERFGSDRGGMEARAVGRDACRKAVERKWTLIAEAGDGPDIPPTPALLLAQKLLAGQGVPVGARPAAGALSLDEIEAGLRPFSITCRRSEAPAPVLFEQVLPGDFARLPAAWRRLAEVHDIEEFSGVGSVERGAGSLSRLAGLVAGFPPAGENLSVTVTKEKTPRGEIWTRDFGDRRFHSHLSRRADDAPGILRERFGPLRFRIELQARDTRVHWPVVGWSFLGLPLPRALAPRSETVEEVGPDGRFRFDVAISLPLAGFVVRYRGWLAPSEAAIAPIPDEPALATGA